MLAGGSGPLYAFLAVVVGSGLLLLLVTFRSGTDEALEASSYPDGEDTAAPSATGQQDRGPSATPSTPRSRPGRRP